MQLLCVSGLFQVYCAVCLVQVQSKETAQRLCSHPFPGAPPGPTRQLRRSRVGIGISPGKETPPGLGVGSSRVRRVCGGHKGTPRAPWSGGSGASGSCPLPRTLRSAECASQAWLREASNRGGTFAQVRNVDHSLSSRKVHVLSLC